MIPILRPSLLQLSGVRAGMSTRSGGVSGGRFGLNLSYRVGDAAENVTENRHRFFAALGISLQRAAFPLQCHSNRVQIARSPGDYPDCDALITSEKDLALAVTVADCVPILIYEHVHRIAAAVHAGWRGTVGRITALTIRRMVDEFDSDPAAMSAFIGPAAGACCYEVGEDVASQIPGKFLRNGEDGRFFPDLQAFNRAQLLEAGLKESHIEIQMDCTICQSSVYHSYRRDGAESGRMLAVLQMTDP